MPPKLSDNAAYDLLHQAAETLGRAEGETVRANTALDAARMMLRLLQLGLLKAAEDDADHVDGLTDRGRSPPPPPG